MEITSTSNIGNKVRNTKLPNTKGLMALFETISNSIHAIEEAKKNNLLNEEGKINIKIIRTGFKEISDNDTPINAFEIHDNGIGLNDENFKSFQEADSVHKIQIGGKGVGRFVCLKVFEYMDVSSIFYFENTYKKRTFKYKSTTNGFDSYEELDSLVKKTGTTIRLNNLKEEYGKKMPRHINDIAREIVMHFQLYFLQKNIPQIILENECDNTSVSLTDFFNREFENDIQNQEFIVGTELFTLFLSKSYNNVQSHKIHFCAHNRSVIDEGLYKRIIDLGKIPIKQEIDGRDFYYQAFVVGDFLNENVDTERVGFNFPKGEDEEGEDDEKQTGDVTLAKIRRAAVDAIEQLLAEYLNQVRTAKMEKYRPLVYDKMPQYRAILSKREDEVKKLQPNLSQEKLDIELYKIDAKWKQEVKEKGIELIDKKKDITNLDEFKELYNSYLNDFNEVGKSELARYVVHRKAVLDLFDKLLSKKDEGGFNNEDLIHSLFFPIRTYSDEIPYEKQNLWLLDERLAYHTFLASDKYFEKIKNLTPSVEGDRADLLIYNDALAFSEEENAPYNSFTIVEFKKPQRDGYIDNDSKKNPLDQVERYVEDLLNGTVENRKGRKIVIDNKFPFFIYIVCDITESFRNILERREFEKTPDGMGYFKFKSKYYSAYIEVIPFEKVMSDAKKRNRILFDKLGLLND